MELAVAESIIGEVKARGLMQAPMPSTDDEKIALAEYLVVEAKTNQESARGIIAEAIEAILGVIPEATEPHKAVQPTNSPESSRETSSKINTDSTPKSVGKPLSEAFEIAYTVAGEKRVEKLPVPPEIEGELPVLEIDMTKLSDLELRRQFSKFNACAQRASWLVSLEEGKQVASERLMDDHLHRALRQLDKTDPDSNRPKLSHVLEAEAASDPKVEKWRITATVHKDNTRKLKALRDSYTSSCERISREFTMREVGYNMEGRLGRGR